MRIVNIQEAMAHLPRIVDQAAKGEVFVITKAGKPLVKVVPITAPETIPKKRLGFMEGQITVPDDFDRMESTEIERIFDGDP